MKIYEQISNHIISRAEIYVYNIWTLEHKALETNFQSPNFFHAQPIYKKKICKLHQSEIM